jgi:hypothetical protein
MNEETKFQKELEELINRHCQENGSNTPDFLLASYLNDCLLTWNRYTQARDKWWGVNLEIGNKHFTEGPDT